MPVNYGSRPPEWYVKLKRCGYRLTISRQVILNVLGNTTKHLSAEDIYMKVHKTYPIIGLTTVYRTLELLVQMALVYKFDFGDGRARYELVEDSKGSGHHHHLVCTDCNTVIDYTDFINEEVELLNQTEKGLSKKYNFRITNHLIQFYGLCGKCCAKK
ncbi:MAG: Fur family transcriptional regulator [bacterium]